MQLTRNIWRKWKGRKKRKESSEKQQNEKERLTEKKEFLARSEEELNDQEQKAREELYAADELVNDAKLKLCDVLSSTLVNKSSIAVVKMMLDTSTTKHEDSMGTQGKI